MAVEVPAAVNSGLLATRAHDSRTMLGHVVVCTGAADDGDEAIAVWHVNTEGANTGAWVRSVSQAHSDPDVAQELLNLCVQRSVTAWDPTAAISNLNIVEDVAGVGVRDWAATAVAIPEALTEIGAIRSAYDKRIAEEKSVKKNTIAVDWEIDVADPVPADIDKLRRYARLARQPGCSAVQDALLTASLLCWCVRRCKENMTVLNRRDYLQQAFGQAGFLQPGWETQLADAFVQRAQQAC